MGDYFIIQPNHHWWNFSSFKQNLENNGKPMNKNVGYASNTNDWWLDKKDLSRLIKKN